MACDDPVANFVVLRFRDEAPRYQFVRALEWTRRDDAVRLMLSHPRQVKQVFPRCGIDVEGLIAAHAFLYALDHSLRVAPQGLGGFGGLPADFIGVVFA